MRKISFLLMIVLLFLCSSCSSGHSPGETESLGVKEDSTYDVTCGGEMPVFVRFDRELDLHIAHRYYQAELSLPLELCTEQDMHFSNFSSFEELEVFWTLVSFAEFPSVPEDEELLQFDYYPTLYGGKSFLVCFTLDSWNVWFSYYPVTTYYNKGESAGTLSIFGESVDVYKKYSDSNVYSAYFLQEKGSLIEVELYPIMDEGDPVPAFPTTPIEGGGLYLDASGELVIDLGLEEVESWAGARTLGEVFEVFGPPDFLDNSCGIGYRLGENKVLRAVEASANPYHDYDPNAQLCACETVEFDSKRWIEYDTSRFFLSWVKEKSLDEILSIPVKPFYCIPGQAIVYCFEEGRYCAVTFGVNENGLYHAESVSLLNCSDVNDAWQPWNPSLFEISEQQ